MDFKALNREQVFHYSIYLFSFALPFDHKFSNNLVVLCVVLWLFTLPKINAIQYWRTYRLSILLFASIFLIIIPGIIHTENVRVALSKLETRYVFAVFPLIIFIGNFTNEQIRKACFWFCTGVVTSSLICIILNILAYQNADVLTLAEQFTYKILLGPLDLHPNFYSIYVSFAVLIALYEIAFNPQSRAKRLGLIIVILYLIALDVLIQSRAPLTALFLVLFLGIGYWIVKFQHARSKAILFLSAALVAFIVVFVTNEKIRGRFSISVSDIKDKMFRPDSEMDTNPQTMSTIFHLRCWYCATGLLSDYHFFTGYGSGDEKDVLIECYKSHDWIYMVDAQLSAHNEYLSSFLRNGLPEFILLLCTLVIPLIRSVRSEQTLYTAFILLWVLILFFCALNRQSALSFYAFFNAMFFKIMCEQPGRINHLAK